MLIFVERKIDRLQENSPAENEMGIEDENGALRGRKWHSVDLEMQAMKSIYDDNGDDKWI